MVWKHIQRFFRKWIRCASLNNPSHSTQNDAISDSAPGRPPPPREILTRRDEYEDIIFARSPPDERLDTPLAALYRLYESIMLDQNINMRNELESFWCHNTWSVKEIPDPRDPDPERYAVLACIADLLVLSFNDRINLGLPRDAPAIITGDLYDSFKMRQKILEEAPPWASEVPALRETLKNTSLGTR